MVCICMFDLYVCMYVYGWMWSDMYYNAGLVSCIVKGIITPSTARNLGNANGFCTPFLVCAECVRLE